MYVKPAIKAVKAAKTSVTPMGLACAPCRGRNIRSMM